ncbi:hypothetical protein H9L10_11905 [Phycicoccus endophyticus]|uniref:Uncharacterized protein n=1 Tax=Phycicoccus endophyticus TaxID=1690220 RepID=A0A7G9R035_9MICO|nr:hypothetical protein [Phycicoccus endophyticus]QNN48960.1 hypothetical protein H9L10_11905 [Phycicoccus endophyticus]GGL45685.1 hypothetical protein GCM10012283_30370 [Phycicoccus endophyticus]
MEVPQHWVRVEGFSPHLGRRGGTIAVWGWSAESDADAEEVGRSRLAETLARIEREGRLPPGHGYYPRTPLREPVLDEVRSPAGDLLGVVTRNRMGCEVLCTDRLLIADIDVPELLEDVRPARRRGRAGGGVTAFLRRLVLGREDPTPMTPSGEDASGLDHPAAAPDQPGGYTAYPADPGEGARVTATGPRGPSVADCLAAEPAWEFARAHPGLGVRVYRTAAGLRVLVTGAGLSPSSPQARRLLTELRSDPLYVELCATHDSYRARLTPKPFRVGVDSLAVRWPCSGPEEERRFLRWVDGYESVAGDYAVCRLVSASGPVPDAHEQALVELHDSSTGVGERLPLA